MGLHHHHHIKNLGHKKTCIVSQKLRTQKIEELAYAIVKKYFFSWLLALVATMGRRQHRLRLRLFLNYHADHNVSSSRGVEYWYFDTANSGFALCWWRIEADMSSFFNLPYYLPDELSQRIRARSTSRLTIHENSTQTLHSFGSWQHHFSKFTRQAILCSSHLSNSCIILPSKC